MEQQTKKQTAVEWLIEQFEKGIQYNPLEKDGYSNARNKLIEQAKEMEKTNKMENTKNEKQCAIHASDSTGLICGATLVKPMCEIKPNTDNDGMGFYIDGKCIIKTLGHTANEQMIILSDAIDSAYKLGYSDASVFLMNRK